MSVGIQRIRDDGEAIRAGARAKGEDPAVVDRVVEADSERRQVLGRLEEMRARRNTISAEIGQLMRSGGAADVSELKAQSVELGRHIAEAEDELRELDSQLDELLLRIPNPPDADVPVGPPSETKTVRSWGEPLQHDAGAWERKPHWEVAENLGILDLAAGAKVTGSGFPLFRGAGARLERTLINWFMDAHSTEHGMTEIWPPIVINQDSARGTGQIPDKEDQMYVVTRDDLYLNPTAEVAVTNIHRDEIIEAAELPIRYVAYSPSFRREAGAAGRQTRGILRVHQFDKVEMVAFTPPADSAATLEWMVERAEVLLQRLGLAYRVRLLSTGDMGFTQAKTYDLEVWAPGVEEWLEVSSVSNFRDFQARRMNIRWRPETGAKPEILHTLNGSGLALPRTVAALIETYQQADGSIALPEPLASKVGPIG
jgi:seryl-tRNA synthetase